MITKLLPKPLTAALSVLAFALLLVAPGSVNAFGGAPNDLWVDITIGPWNSRNIGPGQQYAVGWTIHGQISSCTATGDWSWVYPPSSFQNGVWTNIYGTAVFSAPASGAKTFHLSCSGPTGSAQDTETIHVGNYNDLNPEPWLSLVLNQPDNLCPGCIGTGPGQQMRFQWGINNYAGMSLGTCRAWGDITDFQGTGPIMGPYGSGAEEFRTDPPTYPSPDPTRPQHYIVGLTCSGSYGEITNVQYLDVAPPVPSVDIKANGSDGPITIPYNTSATISWTSQNVSSCTVSPSSWTGTSGSQGSGNLVVQRTYTADCTGSYGSASDSVTVNVSPAPPSVDIKANGSDGPITIPYNTSATISWTSLGATSCTVSPSGWTGTSGSQPSGALTASRTYTANCTGPGGSAQDSVTVNVGAAASPIADIKANGSDGPITIPYNTSATISWTSQNATACTVAPGSWTGTSGSQPSGNLTASRTYNLNCTGPGGSAADSVTVNVTAAAPTIFLNPTSFTFNGVPGGPTPPGQQLTVGNVGGGTLNWTESNPPGKPGTWCHVSPSSGSLAAGATQQVTVTVDAPSNVGTFTDCGIRVSDPAATNNPQDATVTYIVGPGDPGCLGPTCGGGGGGGDPVSGGSGACLRVDLTWNMGTGATGYNVYRNTTNTPPGTPLATVSGTSYQDSAVTAGTAYYYWVETVGGSGTKVPANTNSSGGVTPTSCTPSTPPGNPQTWNTASDATVACSTVKVTWDAVSGSPTGYRVYRSAVGSPYSWQVVPGASNLPPGTVSFTDSAPLSQTNPSYYSVAALYGAAESAKVVAPSIVPTPCNASLDLSDKDLTGQNSASFSVGDCNGFQAPPASARFVLGDTVKFSVNMCNSNTSSATNVTVLDYLTNLAQPSGGWNARYQDTNGAWQSITPTVSGTAPSQTLTFAFPAGFLVPPAVSGSPTVRKLTFEARIAVPAGFSGSFGRFQNKADIRYDRSPGVPTTKQVQTPLIPFGAGSDLPNRTEVAP